MFSMLKTTLLPVITMVDVLAVTHSFFYGAVNGAIVNWCGHKYGYQLDNHDHSKSLPLDFLLMGELMKNNHHKDQIASTLPKVV